MLAILSNSIEWALKYLWLVVINSQLNELANLFNRWLWKFINKKGRSHSITIGFGSMDSHMEVTIRV